MLLHWFQLLRIPKSVFLTLAAFFYMKVYFNVKIIWMQNVGQFNILIKPFFSSEYTCKIILISL